MNAHKMNPESRRRSIGQRFRRLILIPLIASLAVGGWPGQALAGSLAARVTVDFESLGYTDFGDLGTKLITNQGFTITASDGNWETFTSGSGFCNNSSVGCVAMADQPAHAETITLQAVNGDRFKFTSFWIGNHGSGGNVAKVEGFRNGNPTPVATLNSGFPSGGDVSAVNALITLPASFQDVDKVVITSNSSNGFYDVFDDFVFDPPVRVPILATSAASAVTSTGATLNGTADDNTATSTISFDFGTTTAYGANIAATTGGTVTAGTGTTAAAVDLSGLNCATTYHYRVSGTNSFGTAKGPDATFTTAGCAQTITFAQPATQLFGTTPTLTATATSSLVVSFTSSTTGVCTITSGGALTFVTTGTCTINADQAGNAAYSAAPQVSRSFTVAAVVPGAPTIGTATAGNAQASVTFTAPAFTGGASITGYTVTASPGGATGTGASSPISVTGLSNGTSYTFTVTATNSAGTGNPSSASNSVTPIASQTITFAQPATQSFGTTPTLTATATSSLVVSFTSSTTGVCTITSGGALTFVTTGTCTINADQAGDAAYSAAPQVSRSFTVAAVVPGAPTIGTATPGSTQASVTFTAPAFTGGASITGYTVTVSPGGATVTGASSPILVTGLTNGTSYTFTVKASNSVGAGANSAASNAVTPFASTVQTISFAAVGTVRISSPTVNLVVSASSGLPVTLTSTTPTVCSVSGTVLTALAIGTCTIQAAQPGNANFAAAATVSQTFEVLAGVPDAPTLSACVGGNHTAVCTFSAAAANGSPLPTSFTLTCQLGTATPVQVSGAASPLTVAGLTNGQTYQCSVTATNVNGKSTASNAVSAAPFSKVAVGTGMDINGDGKAEILLRAAGTTSMATLNANNHLDFAPISGPGPEWRVLGTGDFRGTHRSDLLIQNIATGAVYIWFNFDGPPDSSFFVRNVKPNWTVEAIDDLDGDGKSDIVWRYINPVPGDNDSGVVFVWFMDGVAIREIKSRGGAPASWNLIGTTDINGDGMGDLIWESPTGQARALVGTSGRNFVNTLLGSAPTGYNQLKVTDLDGDGFGDLLFRNAAGKVKMWRMNGSTVLAEIDLPATDPTWTFYAATDLNGDGTGDIIWKKADGTLVLWLMNAASPGSPTIVDPAGTAPTGYNVVE